MKAPGKLKRFTATHVNVKANQRKRRWIEATESIRLDPCADPLILLRWRQLPKVLALERWWRHVVHELQRLAEARYVERRPQRRMPRDQSLDYRSQRIEIEPGP